MIAADIKVIAAATDVERAFDYERLIRQARVRKWVHTGVMLLAAVLALAWTAWMLIFVAIHWGLASLYEEPWRIEHEIIVESEHRELLRDERYSHFVIERMRKAELVRQWPEMLWVSAVLTLGMSTLALRLFANAPRGPSYGAGVGSMLGKGMWSK